MRKRLCFILFALSVVFGVMAQNDTVVFSARGGFYDEVFSLELYHTQPQNHIRYTINGYFREKTMFEAFFSILLPGKNLEVLLL